ncbi:MarR family winged helix-turn-helix transcriptional regulator [Rhizohabitans arisaemae]|uniref:MarR family winged helix-turn-helix transcriptional regulator n=1 Tax=Rhizohabitans arisaemae TaxID=2720610 RepID=UPI0024B1BEF4|nr:MarR family transcriptional regulator [Rhizohabitans arisaemae]
MHLKSGHGLTLEDYGVLVALAAAPDSRVRMSELAEVALISQSRLSHQVKRMEERGMIRREPCLDDRRGTWAVLTGQGRDILDKAARTHVEDVRRHFIDLLSRQDLRRLTAMLTPVLKALEPSEALVRLMDGDA